MFRYAASAALVLLAGCGTLTESRDQQILVQTVLDHRPVDGVGCVLANDAGRWFVTTPARVVVRKSAGPLRVDCRKEGAGGAEERVDSRQNRTLWGNYVLTGGLGNYVDRNTGRGFDYPPVLTVILRGEHGAEPRAAPPEGRAVY
ncbi:hypothetical protein [Pseudoduganella namucuonensis]|uniref:Lipoprotein n=1 Tax=Pseudoduganella namucuonensis TaxID=1035707 RepID=A0A1I7LYF7_9BURK|nr:hypothetical protein [Pseudoduganella namucuonensis]SFV14736.1 hypothetical protein SAMN05216552_104343 [Pseudoduganella namucuonensis]